MPLLKAVKEVEHLSTKIRSLAYWSLVTTYIKRNLCCFHVNSFTRQAVVLKLKTDNEFTSRRLFDITQ